MDYVLYNMTKVELELIFDANLHLLFVEGMRRSFLPF